MSLNIRDQTSLAVQWLTLHVPSAGGTSLILGLGIKIPHDTWPKTKIQKEATCYHSWSEYPRNCSLHENLEGDWENME